MTSSESVVSNYATGLILRTNGARETLKTIMQTPEESSWSAFNVDPSSYRDNGSTYLGVGYALATNLPDGYVIDHAAHQLCNPGEWIQTLASLVSKCSYDHE